MAVETLKKYIKIYEAHPNNKQFQAQLAKLKKARPELFDGKSDTKKKK
jgi:hypothetical protein